MAHNLTITNGETEMAYYGETPWHGLGQRLENVATGPEMLQAAKLDWTVSKRPLFTTHRPQLKGSLYQFAGWSAITRDDNDHVVGVVGDDYEPFQNAEVFDFLDALVGEASAMYHTAGSLGGGSRVWALAKLPGQLVILPDDAADKFLLGWSAHDGSTALTCKFTTVRVVCQNTLTAAIQESGTTWQVKVRHTKGIHSHVEEARRVLQISLQYFEVLGYKLRALTAKQITEQVQAEYFNRVLPITVNTEGEESSRMKNIHTALGSLADHGVGTDIPGVRGTLWGAYNAVTEWVDHVRVCKKGGELREGWAEAALFGSGAHVKQRALDEALALAERL